MSTTASADPVVQSAARWFWWIAGLSLVNTVLFHSGSDINFVVGLGMTTMASILFADNLALAWGLAAITIGFYFLMGWLAQQGRMWAFILGIAVYALDALIYVKFQDWMSVAFHGIAIFFIAKGMLRLRELANSPVAPSAEAPDGQRPQA